jgi:hypothetical protein
MGIPAEDLQTIWRRWIAEHLVQLQCRKKFTDVRDNLKEGDVVFNSCRGQYKEVRLGTWSSDDYTPRKGWISVVSQSEDEEGTH